MEQRGPTESLGKWDHLDRRRLAYWGPTDRYKRGAHGELGLLNGISYAGSRWGPNGVIGGITVGPLFLNTVRCNAAATSASMPHNLAANGSLGGPTGRHYPGPMGHSDGPPG